VWYQAQVSSLRPDLAIEWTVLVYMLQMSNNKDLKLLSKIITILPLNKHLCGSSHAKKFSKIFMFHFWECLGKYISKIIISCAVLY